jgi:hypothetical protein
MRGKRNETAERHRERSQAHRGGAAASFGKMPSGKMPGHMDAAASILASTGLCVDP